MDTEIEKLAAALAEKLAEDESIQIVCPKCGHTSEDVNIGPDCPQCGKPMVRRDAMDRMAKLLEGADEHNKGIPKRGDSPPFKEADEVPWIIDEGKTFHCIFHVRIPECSDYLFGGDTTGMIWNFDDEPHSLRLVYRMRYYNSPDPHDTKDEKKWYSFHVDGRDRKVEDVLKFTTNGLCTALGLAFCTIPPEVDVIWINGDHKKAMELFHSGKVPWMHVSKRKEGAK